MGRQTFFRKTKNALFRLTEEGSDVEQMSQCLRGVFVDEEADNGHDRFLLNINSLRDVRVTACTACFLAECVIFCVSGQKDTLRGIVHYAQKIHGRIPVW